MKKSLCNIIAMLMLATCINTMATVKTDSIYSTVGEDSAWQTIDAIKSGKFYEVPAAPYNWISTPPSVNQIMGLQWLSRLCYPDKFSDDIATVTKDYYKNVYGYELGDDECQKLIANAS